MVTPLRSRTEAIVKIPTPCTLRQCKSFCGVGIILSGPTNTVKTHNSTHKERNTLSMGKGARKKPFKK